MVTTPYSIDHIVLDEHGVARIAGTRMKVRDIARDARQGHRADDIQEAYEHLTMAQIHAALSYYYDHQAEVEAEIEEADRTTEELREQLATPEAVALRERLSASRTPKDAT